MPRPARPAVAASSQWTGDDGIRYPGGDTHAWEPGRNETLCGVPLSRARLARFPHVPWGEALWLADTGDRRVALCRRCTAATRAERGRRRHPNPRP